MNTRNRQKMNCIKWQVVEYLEVVDNFHSLTDQASSGRRYSKSIDARIRKGKVYFRELWSLLTTKDLFVRVEGKLCYSCVQTAMLSSKWKIGCDYRGHVNHRRNESSMFQWMYNVNVHVWRSGCILREKLSITGIRCGMQGRQLFYLI